MSNDLETEEGRANELYSHAMGILRRLRRAEKLPDSKWRGKTQTRQEFIEEQRQFVQEDIDAGILPPDVLNKKD
jgi:hypothetical protein